MSKLCFKMDTKNNSIKYFNEKNKKSEYDLGSEFMKSKSNWLIADFIE